MLNVHSKKQNHKKKSKQNQTYHPLKQRTKDTDNKETQTHQGT